MQEGRQNVKVEAAGSTCYHITLWNKIGWDPKYEYTDGPIHSVFAENATMSHFNDTDTQI